MVTPATNEIESAPRSFARSNASQRIIAAGILLVFLYYAASVLMTIVLAILLAYFLDPVVQGLEKIHVPRAVGSLVVVLLMVALIAAALTETWYRVEGFVTDWPKYSAKLRSASQSVEKRLEKIEQGVNTITPEQTSRGAVRIEEPHAVRNLLFQGLGSITNVLIAATFVPFLVFFMLAGKVDAWHATLQLFPSTQRTQVKKALEEVGSVLRGYVMGNVFIAVILSISCSIFFYMLDLDYPVLIGILAGTLNLVPYFGTVLSSVPPLVVGLSKWDSPGKFILVILVMALFHLFALNVLFPALVGRRVQLNALAVTLSLLFWGWLWGGMGLLLGIPITASLKVICDHMDGWEPVGRWLSA
jgi:predicted PurR-regulated permease PerM